MVFEYRVLRGIFGPKMDEVTEDWRRLHIKNFTKLIPRQITLG